MGLFVGLLFVVLTPGVLFRIPKRGKPLTVALIHGLVFGVIFHFTVSMVYNTFYSEGFESNPTAQCSELYNRATVTKVDILKLNQTLETLMGSISSSQTAIKNVCGRSPGSDQCSNLKNSLEQRNKRIEDTKANISAMNSVLADVKKLESEECNGNTELKAEKCKEISDKLTQFKNESSTLKDEFSSLTNELKDMNTKNTETCRQKVAASRGRLSMGACLSAFPVVATTQHKINELKVKLNKINKDMNTVSSELAVNEC